MTIQINPEEINPNTVSPTEFGYLAGVTSSIQDQLDAKISLAEAEALFILVDDLDDYYTKTEADGLFSLIGHTHDFDELGDGFVYNEDINTLIGIDTGQTIQDQIDSLYNYVEYAVADGETAFSWGNHAEAGYVLSTQPVDNFGATTDNTNNDATTSKHGFLPKIVTSNFNDIAIAERYGLGRYVYFEDFLQMNMNYIFDRYVSSGGGFASLQPSATNQVGCVRFGTGTGASTVYCSMRTGANACVFGGGTWTLEWYMKIIQKGSATNIIKIVMGFLDTNSATEPSTNGIWFGYDNDDATTDTNIICYNKAGGSSHSVDSSVVVDNSFITSYHKYKIEVNADASEVKYYIDDALVATENVGSGGKIPSGTGQCSGIGMGIARSGDGTTSLYMVWDWLLIQFIATTTRT